MSTVVKTPTFCIHVYAKTKAQISIAVSAKLISAFVFAVLKLPSYGKVIITILNVRVACLFVVGLCSNFIKKLVLKSAIRSMLNVFFATSHFSVVPIYAAILSKNQLVYL